MLEPYALPGVSVRIYRKGARPCMSACGWCFFLFFSKRQHCSTKKEEGREKKESEWVGWWDGEDSGKVELTEMAIDSLQWCGRKIGPSLLDSFQYQFWLTVCACVCVIVLHGIPVQEKYHSAQLCSAVLALPAVDRYMCMIYMCVCVCCIEHMLVYMDRSRVRAMSAMFQTLFL